MYSDKRLKSLQSWINDELGIQYDHIEPASADASFRRYFRVTMQQGTMIAMDAPPDKEDMHTFINTDHALIEAGVRAPAIKYQDIQKGFLLLEDLGNETALQRLQQSPQQADSLYLNAIKELILLQQGLWQLPSVEMPSYDADKLNAEMQLFNDWYVERHLGITLDEKQLKILNNTKKILTEACLEQPIVWVHRDYHSRNLMLLENNDIAVIDFQDMVQGPISYDLVSLFKDCYIQWPRQQQLDWLANYHQLIDQAYPFQIDFDDLVRWYDFTGLQRHLKVLGIFCRLYYRDKKSQYLNDLPMVKSYVQEVCQLYPELAEFKSLFTDLH